MSLRVRARSRRASGGSCSVRTLALGGVLLVAAWLAGCDRCERPTASFAFGLSTYYVWAWKESGGALPIGGVILGSEREVESLVLASPPACPPPDEAFRFASDPASPPELTIGCLNTRARPKRPGVDPFDCNYQCEYEYCEGRD